MAAKSERSQAEAPSRTPKAASDTAPASQAPVRALATSGVFMAVVVGGAALYWLRGILTPLALAIFLLVMVEGFSGWLKRRIDGLPDWAAVTIALTTLAAAFVSSTWLIANNATSFVSQLSGYGPRLNMLIADVAGSVGVAVPPTIGELITRTDPTQYIARVAQGLQNFVSNAVFVLIYLGFLIASRAGFKNKWDRLFPKAAERQDAKVMAGRISQSVERYLWVQTVTGLLIAVVSWIAMAIAGLDNAVFWAFLIFVVGYIPVIGPLIGGLLPPLFALVQFDSYGPAISLLIALNALNFVVGNVLLPRMQGDSLNLDPIALLLSLAFWGALWGLPGMFLSTPLTVLTMVILAQFKGSRWIAILMSSDGRPMGDLKPKAKSKS